MAYTYLAHHGIKGMKWGVRRYQNPDGTLTPEGRKRYYKSSGDLTKQGIKALEKRRKAYYDSSDDTRFDPKTLRKKLVKSGESKAVDRAERRLALYDKLTKNSDKIESLDLERLAVKEQNRLSKQGKDFTDECLAAYDLQMTALFYHQFVQDEGKDFVSRTFAGLTDRDQQGYTQNEEFKRIANSDVVKKYPHDYNRGGQISDFGYFNNKLWEEINSKSINYYEDKTYSERARKASAKLKKAQNKHGYISSQYKEAKQELLSAVLKDLKLPDTQENRDAIENHVIWH